MNDLGVNSEDIISWFPHEQDAPFVLIRVRPEDAQAWAEELKVPIRRCYITDAQLTHHSNRLGAPEADVIASKLPDPGATMAGDFGEILVYLYQGTRAHPSTALGATKWRLKQDRTKPSPYSDVVHLELPSWPAPSTQDCVSCSEVKTKSTDGASTPIADAIKDSAKDRISRLGRTLVWLRDRALTEDLGDIQLTHLKRFINANDYPPAKKRFSAVAVICATLAQEEMMSAPTEVHPDYSVVVITVPELRTIYTASFAAARQAVVGP
jgi:hypothetical protein